MHISLFCIPFLFQFCNALCAQQVRYYDCYNKGTLAVMGCEKLNFGDLYTYYSCLCDTNRGLHDCYNLCTDDDTMLLESQTAIQNVNAICMKRDQYPTPTTTVLVQTSSNVSNATRTTMKAKESQSSTSTTTTFTSTTTRKSSIMIMSNDGHPFHHHCRPCIIVIFVAMYLLSQ
jgi:hypothetical protein